MGVLIAEQNHVFALGMSSRAVFIESGAVVWDGTTKEVEERDLVTEFLAL